ncbi:MAG: MMPL family transporter [Treponema sp.]|jgi:predicted RND superfamily exporter protein|nr:MMPL family transporter [Treponema sp.]
MDKLYRHPWLIIAVIALVTAFFAFQLPRLELDNNNFRFISEKDPARQVAASIDDIFGSSLFILVGLRREYGDVFDPAFLNLVRDYVERVEAIDIIDPVSSIVNADYVTGDGESVVVEKLLPDDFSGTAEEVARLKERILSWEIYRRSLISDDFSSTQILVPMNVPAEDAGRPEVVDRFIRVRDIAREMFAGQAEVYVTGIPVISATINEAVRSDLTLLVPLVIIVVLLVLFFSFRRLSSVVLPLLTVVIATVWSMGAMPLFNVKLSVISTVLPVILVAVGSAYGIHVITHYMEDRIEALREAGRRADGTAAGDNRGLVLALMRRIIRPILLAALTTLAGFLSFCFTTVLPIREFGFFSAFGTAASFAVAVTLIPALLLVRSGSGKTEPERTGGNSRSGLPPGEAGPDRLRAAVARFFSAAARRRRGVLCGAAALTLVAAAGASRLVIDNVFVEYFRDDTDIAKSDRFIREQFGGSKVISVVAEAPTETLLGPASLLAMDGLSRFLERSVPGAGKTMGFTDLIKRINQVFNAGESPKGLGPSPALSGTNADGTGADGTDTEGSGDFGFGFGGPEESPANGGFGVDGGFGFGGPGNFGVDDAAEFGFGAFEKDGAPPPEAESAVHTAEDMIALISRAARSGNQADLSAGELAAELKKLVNYEGAAYYEIPADPAKYGKTGPEELSRLVSNYLVLLSGSVDSYANDPLEPTAIKTTVQLRTLGEADTGRAVEAIGRFVKAVFPPEIKVTVGGSALVEASLNHQVVRSQIISLIVSLFLVFVIIALSNRSPAAGILGVAALGISILVNFAVMGFLGIKLNLGTSMIASLAVGIGIDYTIHYMESFRRECAARYRSREELARALAGSSASGDFLEKTFAVSGKAIIINAVSVGAGFAVLIFSRFNMLAGFGLLIALTMIISALVSLTVIPALLLTVKPAFIFRDKGDSSHNKKAG